MRKQKFKEILEEYISDLEKDYDFDIKGNSNHPTFSLIQNTYQKLKDKYYYRKLGFTLTYFLFCIVYLGITIVFPSLPLTLFIISPFLILIIFYLVVTKLIKTPDLIDITSLGDRILLVREKVKNFDFDFFVVKEMIIDIDKIYHLESLPSSKSMNCLTRFLSEEKSFSKSFALKINHSKMLVITRYLISMFLLVILSRR